MITTLSGSPEELKSRKAELEGLVKKFQILYRKKVWEHEDQVQRSYYAVTTGILSILNKNEKTSATYRRSLNADIQLHCKIQLRNLFLLRIRERAMLEEIEAIKNQLQEMGYREEPAGEEDSQQLAEMETDNRQPLTETETAPDDAALGDEAEAVTAMAAAEETSEATAVESEDSLEDLPLDPTEDTPAA